MAGWREGWLELMLSGFRRACYLWGSYLVVVNIACVWVAAARAAASVEFTSIPPYGSFNNLQGKVYGVNPASNRVAVFIYVNDAGWFTKPTCANPLTTIQPDGTWTADITTGGSDQNATRIAAYVVPDSFSQPCVTNVFCIPVAVEDQAIASAMTTRVDPATRSFHWSGYDWWVKNEPVTGWTGSQLLLRQHQQRLHRRTRPLAPAHHACRQHLAMR